MLCEELKLVANDLSVLWVSNLRCEMVYKKLKTGGLLCPFKLQVSFNLLV